uniref:Uncharacterized protein n=1 Tax=Anguilla anguilla TaxID=7936 RepID=A0A0E9U044_ANGAN
MTPNRRSSRLLITSGTAIGFHFQSTTLITIGTILLLLTIYQ